MLTTNQLKVMINAKFYIINTDWEYPKVKKGEKSDINLTVFNP